MKNYEWDKNKRELNLEKHEIDLLMLSKYLTTQIESSARATARERKRAQTIGMVAGIVILLVYTVRQGKKRIISARRACKNERETYYEEKS